MQMRRISPVLAASAGLATMAAMATWVGTAAADTTASTTTTTTTARPVPVALPGTGLDPGMAAAMRRDLKLTDAQIDARLRTEAGAAVVEKRLRAALGASWAGAWIPAGGTRLTVAVTDPKAAAAVRAEGADVRIVTRNERRLTATRTALDVHAARAGRGVHSWHVDTATNTVVVRAATTAAATAFVRASRADTATVRVETTTEAAPRPMYDIRGGDQYVINGNTLCSVGFSVNGGFVIAGHCGGVGSPTLGVNNVAQGTFRGSSFPGNDYAWVQTNGNWTPQPWVNNYAGGNVTVAGSNDAAIGASVCRSGRTTGWRCGVVQARNVSVSHPQGVVSGLTRSNACAEGGDSGGAWVSGNQAQGVTSGGSGNCSTGGTMYYQPVNEILGTYGLTLVTTGGGGSTSRVISNWHNKCVDVPNGNYADGQRLIVWDCTNGANQNWEFTGGTLRTQNNKCMDVAGGGTAAGTPIQIANCNGNPAQQFVLSGAGDLVNPQSNRCVDIDAWNPNNNAVLIIWDCTGGANQKWRRG
jgi:streptogrisin C